MPDRITAVSRLRLLSCPFSEQLLGDFPLPLCILPRTKWQVLWNVSLDKYFSQSTLSDVLLWILLYASKEICQQLFLQSAKKRQQYGVNTYDKKEL